ncbi:MAG: prolipoprotein diacylglyceryl transferase [Prevotellaceae bacterium]|jgi:prolipoprotein diacylglyceryl transferase|nr:prolipoprotein diacylglyceryl transferase [Prevotellaceae bacterium]
MYGFSGFMYVNWDVSNIIFQIGSFAFRWYALMFILSFAFGMSIFARMVKREHKPASLSDNILVPVALSTFLGARLGHFLFYEPSTFIDNFWYIFIPIENGSFSGFAGLASHGAAIGILTGLYWFSRKNKVPYLWTLDRIVITVALAGFFIRTGNLMNSEVYGRETSLPWGFIFVRAGETAPRHPSQIYEALSYLLIFVFLYLVYLKKRPPYRDGVIFSLFLILVFGARFFIEFLKEVQAGFERNMILDMGQLLSVPLVGAGVVLLWHLKRKGLTVQTEERKYRPIRRTLKVQSDENKT